MAFSSQDLTRAGILLLAVQQLENIESRARAARFGIQNALKDAVAADTGPFAVGEFTARHDEIKTASNALDTLRSDYTSA